MKRNASLAAALVLAVTAAARIPSSHAPAIQSEVQAGKATVRRLEQPRLEPQKGYAGGCSAYDVDGEKLPPDENRGSAKKVLDKFFATDPHRETAESLSSLPGVRYAIALAPDPRHTNLSLVFDREMAVVQQAAQDDQYTYDSSWLPWGVDQATYPLLLDQQNAEDLAGRREACPGLLLFRKAVAETAPAPGGSAIEPYREALIVLVVGEQPTGGLNEDQWNNAVCWLSRNAAGQVTQAQAAAAEGCRPAPQPTAHAGGTPAKQSSAPAGGTPAPDSTSPHPPFLPILGPNFSGSLVSLGRDLGRIYPVDGKPQGVSAVVAAKFPEARVLSGSVSDCESVRWFQGLAWPQRPDPASQSGKQPGRQPDRNAVVFGTFTENDDLQIYRFLSYLKSQSGKVEGKKDTTVNDTAIISEDETAYSGRPADSDPATNSTADGSEPPRTQHAAAAPQPGACAFPYASDHRPVRLSYPRDISALRNAYQKESIFASSTTGSSEHSAHTILQEGGEQVEDGGNPSDTIQAYSRHLTPFAQEAQLYGLVSYLRAHHTRYLLLRCTNPLDFLFLTRFFHRAYPEGRIVTVGADLLFRREIDTTEFRGVFALSSYPLVPRNQHWSILSEQPRTLPGHAHRAFEASTIEGTYIAARYLFVRDVKDALPGFDPSYPTSISLPLMDSLPEYADPFWMHSPGERIGVSHAPTWLAVVGREGYWPIAVLNDESTPDAGIEKNGNQDPSRDKPPSTLVRLTGVAAHYDMDLDGKHFNESLRAKLPLAWTLSAGLALVLLVYQTAGILLCESKASGGLFSAFRKVDACSQDILLGCNCAFASMLLGTLVSIRFTIPSGDMFASADWEWWGFALGWIASVAAILASLWRKRSRYAILCYPLLLAILVALFVRVLHNMIVPRGALATANGIPLFYRMGHITSGVAPLMPVLFVLSGFYLWSWHAMAGNVLLCNGRPKLPMQEGVPERTGFQGWYWGLIGNPVDETGAGNNRLKASESRLSQELGKTIVAKASPLGFGWGIIILPLCLLLGSWICFHNDLPLLTMEGGSFAWWLNFGLLVAFVLIATEATRLFWTWIELRRLLSKLNRLRLRRTFARLRAVEARSLWGMSGSVEHVQHLFFAQQFDAARRLLALRRMVQPPAEFNGSYLYGAVECGKIFDDPRLARLSKGSRWALLIERPSDNESVTIRDAFSDAVAEVINLILLKCWKKEGASLNLVTDGALAGASSEAENGAVLDLPLSKNLTIRTAEEFVCFHYIAFIQNILARMRTMALSMILLFVAVSLAISFYPFVPRTSVTMWMIVNLILIGSAVVYVYADMDRDAILSYIGNTRPGRLSVEFWLKTAGFMAGPVIGIIATQFPAVADSVLGWVQPGLDAIK